LVMPLLDPCPLDEILPDLREKIRLNPAVVLHAPPGAGKTTRVPLALLDILPPEKGRIVMLEPRRIAAVSAARWMAKTLGEEPGDTVGYSIRFDSRVSKATRIEVVTEGILTRRIQNDPALDGVGLVIYDEFHERSLHADLALALCIEVRSSLRPDLKIMVMSATLDSAPVSSLLGGAPVVVSGGRAFPVEERYLPGKRNGPLSENIAEAVGIALKETEGDILVFLPGSGEIRACADALQETVCRGRENVEVHTLYGDLPFELQERAILPSRKRKIVLATNIAETSLTIQGVRAVIDSGLTRRLRYDPSTGMNRLTTLTISQASAEQRKGRAGRLAPGVCYRLYTPQAFRSMIPFSPPEILVSDLSSLVLELAAWGVKDSLGLSWLDAPPASAWESARRLLTDLRALDHSGGITSMGRSMVRLPLHPRLAKMTIRGSQLGFPGLAADLAALLSERDVMRRGRAEGRGFSKEPDIYGRLEALDMWRTGKETPAGTDEWALRAVDRTSKQLVRLIGPAGTTAGKVPDSGTVAELLLCAFPDGIAGRRKEGGGRFVMAQGRGVRLPETSRLSKSPFIVAVNVDAGEHAEGIVHTAASVTEDIIRNECAELLGTFRRVAWDNREERIVAKIEERIGAVLLSSKPFDPPDEEVAPILCEVIRANPGVIMFSEEALQLQGRVGLLRRAFSEEEWPDFSAEHLLSSLEEWLLPWLNGVRNRRDLGRLNICAALKAGLSRKQLRLLDERAPAAVGVPSGHRIRIDYASGDNPVLAVKLQELFGLADSPEIAGGRVRLLLHLLSPSRRPVQITQDLRTFWERGYHQVKKELKGRYPKHPWPDDPWNALPTRRTKSRGG
jgi:ATP-dependent helicase HrpB